MGGRGGEGGGRTRSSDPSKMLLLADRFLCFLIFCLDVKERGNDSFQNKTPGARFSKLPVITGPVKLFCFLFQMGVSKLLKINSKVFS